MRSSYCHGQVCAVFQVTDLSLHSHMVEEARELCGSPRPIHWRSTLTTRLPPRGPTPLSLGVRLSKCEFGREGKHRYSTETRGNYYKSVGRSGRMLYVGK